MLKVISLSAAIIVVAALFVHFFVVTSADAAKFGPECERWIGKEFGQGKPAQISDYWKHWGKLVFEVSVARPGDGSSRTVFLCVVDKAKGTMMKPSVFEDWR